MDLADFLLLMPSIDLTVRGINHYRDNLQSLDSIALHREPNNIHGMHTEISNDVTDT